jgi:hypothetical protein
MFSSRLVTAVALAVVSWQLGASASELQACLDASNQGQTLRDGHKLIEARNEFRACGRVTCPAVVRRDCVTWLEEVEKDISSLALEAKDIDGNDLVEVTVTLDGSVVTTKLDGRSIEVNAGPHALHFALPDGTSTDEQVLVHEGDKNHVVTAVLRKPAPMQPRAAPARPSGSPGPAAVDVADAATVSPSNAYRSQRMAGVVVGVAGLAGVVVGGVFGGLTFSSWANANRECPSHAGCSSQATGDRNRALTDGTVSTVTVIAGAILLAGGITVYFTAPRPHSPSLGVQILPGGIGLTGAY